MHSKRDEMLGGSATFFSTAASFFAPVHVVAVVGDDFDDNDLEFLANRQVDFSGLQKQPGKTFRWGGIYSDDFSNRKTIFTHLNVFEKFQPHIPAQLRQTPYVFLANIGPDLQLNVLSQMGKPKFVALDTMNFWIDRDPETLRQVLARVDGLIINDEEAKMLTGENNQILAMQKIEAMGPKVLIVKKGEHGAVLYYRRKYFYLPAFPVENLIDPTGAGDTFAGGFMGYLAAENELNHDTLRNAVVLGSALASFNVAGFGVDRLKEIGREEIFARYEKFQELTRFEFLERI
ncbi:MAG TPA: sugar kinase [Bacteroidetes bacterium]|nr:sugar kinase [Bacteroidota bacterium]